VMAWGRHALRASTKVEGQQLRHPKGRVTATTLHAPSTFQKPPFP
jgi:hypothetical protein